jgi:hypothetical protein
VSDTSEAKVIPNTVDRAMLTRSGKVLPAVELTGSTIPKDRPIKWAWGNSKKGKSKARLEAYRNATTYAEAINLGMREADFEFDVMHQICAVEGLLLPRAAVKAGLQGECFVCLGKFTRNPRGRMFRCRHQACYDCEANAGVINMRCACGNEIVRSV